MVVINANVNLPIISENDDSDIVGFEVQRHSSDSTGKFDHFSGLNFLQSEDSGNSVSDADDGSVFLDVVQLRDLGNFLLQSHGCFTYPQLLRR